MNVSIQGKVTATVLDEHGNIKQISENHNIITSSGDSLIADVLQDTPARQKIDNAHGYIVVGTGWTGTSIKTNVDVNTQTGVSQGLDPTYPKVKEAWGDGVQPDTDSNIIQYKATYLPGSLNAMGINEAAIVSAALPGATTNCLAYAQITPAINVAILDSLILSWEISFVGA